MAAYNGFLELEEDKGKSEMYRLRWQAMAILVPHMKKAFDWSFDWEKSENERPKLTAQEMAALSAKLDAAGAIPSEQWKTVTAAELLAASNS